MRFVPIWGKPKGRIPFGGVPLHDVPPLRRVRGDWIIGPQVTGVADDSRQVSPGDVFVAVRGSRFDGHAFVPEAVARGAVAVVAERAVGEPGVPVVTVKDARLALAEVAAAFFGYPARQLRLIAVTGTAGKSTTVEWLCHVLSSLGEEVEALSSLRRPGIEVGAPGLTTPGALTLQRSLAEAARAGSRTVIVEVTSHAIAQRRIAGLEFVGAILTTLGRDHLDFHGTMARYVATKRSLFRALAAEALAVLPTDPQAASFASRTRARVLTYGPGGSIEVTRTSPYRGGAADALLRSSGREAAFAMHLPGPGMAKSAAAAAAWAVAEGAPLEDVARSLGTMTAVPGRLQEMRAGGAVVLIDYGHNPPGIATALAAAREVAGEGRVIAVLGAPGHRDRGKLPEMGRLLAGADQQILTSETPEGESPAELAGLIATGIREAGSRPVYVEDRQDAVTAALEAADEGDVVLLLGRGTERFQDFGDVVLERTDEDLVNEAASRLGLAARVIGGSQA